MSVKSDSYVLEPEAIKLLTQYNIPYPDHAVAQSADEAIEIAERLGYPVVLKIVSLDVLHKSDEGGVITGLGDAEAVRRGFVRVVDNVQARVPGARIEGTLVCSEAPAGLEVIVGALEDATFGPTIMFGLGGIFTEIYKDVSFRVAPLHRWDAEEMVREIKGYPMLAGARGQKPCDVDTLVDLILSVSRLITERDDIKELDINPIRVYDKGLLALDARLVLKR
jgi:acyl-CoA synthetase (NDP forming)